MIKWQGVFPAVTTKMDKSGHIDVLATQRGVDRLIENGVSGVIERAEDPVVDEDALPSTEIDQDGSDPAGF